MATDAIARVRAATTHYDVLGVEESAEAVDIRRAYRRLSLLLHPNKNPSASASDAFSKLGEAMQVLGDQARRQGYNLLLASRRSVQRPNQWPTTYRAHCEACRRGRG